MPLFYESNCRYLHHMLHILSNMQLNQNQMWSKVLNLCRPLTHWPLAYNHVWLPTKSPPPPWTSRRLPLPIPPTPRFPEQLECVTLTVIGGRRSDICFCSQGSVCLLVSGSTEPSASHPRVMSSCETTTRPDARPLLPFHPLLFSCVVRNYAQRATVDNKRGPVCFSC